MKKNQQTRKEQLRDRAIRYANARDPMHYRDESQCWRDGYRAALKDVRRAAGKMGVPSAVLKLLAPMR